MSVLSDALATVDDDAAEGETDAHPSRTHRRATLGEAFAIEADLSGWAVSLDEIDTLASVALLLHRLLT